MKKLLSLVLLLSSSVHALDCGNLRKLGMGELGDAPSWLIPYCTGTAEKIEKTLKTAYPDAKLIQIYEVILNEQTVVQIPSKLNGVMRSAGYQFLSRKSFDGTVALNYYNAKNKYGYTVFIAPKQIDHYFALVKYKLPK